MNPFFVTDFSISDSLKTVRKSVLIYETIIGWRYPSIKNNFEDNICFRSERVMYNLKLVGAIIAIFNKSGETDPREMKMSVEYVGVGQNIDNYYSYNSKEGEEYMEKLFSEFFRE